MKPLIDILLIGSSEKNFTWQAGKIWLARENINEINNSFDSFTRESGAEFIYICRSEAEFLSLELLYQVIALPGDIWHDGTGYYKNVNFDFLINMNPTWMFLNNAQQSINATSWKFSLNNCVIKKKVFLKTGFLTSGYQSTDWAALEFGLRCMRLGVFLRYSPLFPFNPNNLCKPFSHNEEWKFLSANYPIFWVFWSLLISGKVLNYHIFHNVITSRKQLIGLHAKNPPYHKNFSVKLNFVTLPRITVLIPTLDRPEYVNSLLNQIEKQTLLPYETILIDQSGVPLAIDYLRNKYSLLKIKYFHLKEVGQSSARNLGIKHSTGDYILFLDDDIDIPLNLIENHLCNLQIFKADASVGSISETRGETIPFTIQTSEVFPTGNSMIKKNILTKTGLFDLAFDKGSRADMDLGMRIYLNGGLMVYNSSLMIFHFRAPNGGLRTHKARKITLESSKKSLVSIHLPSATECYVILKYFGEKHLDKFLIIRLLGTIRVNGNKFRKLAKFCIAGIYIPVSIYHLIRVKKSGWKLYNQFKTNCEKKL